MKRLEIDRIYSIFPVFIQNLLVSLYGLRQGRLQRGGEYRHFLKILSANSAMDENALSALQLSKLKNLIALCERDVPYYRDIFEQCGISSANIASLNDLRRFPLLEKESVRRNPETFLNPLYNPSRLLRVSTSGTTGTPLRIYFNSSVRQLNYAYYDRFLSMSHIPYDGKRATFGGRVVAPVNQRKPPYWRLSRFQKNLLFSIYHLKPEHLSAYAQRLKSYVPDFIEAYPSAITPLARFINHHSVDMHGVTNAIVTSAETLLPSQRKEIESAFGAPVVDQYGSAEMAVFIGQCKAGRYHVHPDYGVVEFLNADGGSAKPGEEAEIVCTGFVNTVMPLIRYRIGDRGVYSDRPCECGLQFPVVEQILGRVDDAVMTPDGGSVSRFGAVLYGLPVKEVQYEQHNRNELVVKIVRDSSYTGATEKQIVTALRKRLGAEIAIVFSYVETLERGPRGKLKTILSHLDSNLNQ